MGVAPVTTKKPEPKRRTDWDAVERDYRTGKYTLRELEAKHGPSYAEISRRARKQGWTKDLREVIKQATDAAVLRESVTEAQKDVTETILVAAELNKQVILKHRGDIARTNSLAMEMLQELSLTTHKQEEIEELFEKLTGELDGAALSAAQQQFRDFMKVHNRVGSVHKLADTLAKLQTLERKAFGIADEGDGEKPASAEPVFNITLTRGGVE